ncbi:MAG: ribokinase, partial [bacterium]|nr:ribokinase [bacterium]
MTTAEILARFRDLSALVVGDICLDRWCTYDPAEADVSRETGIPRIGVVGCDLTPGAGGTVANNLAALGVGRVAVLGAVGEDGFGWELRRALEARGIESGLLVSSAELQTFTYTKLLNSATGEEDRPRVDFINTRATPRDVETRILDQLRTAAERFDVILVSDQAETAEGGVVTDAVRELLSRLGSQKLVWVDSRLRSELFRGVVVKPNKAEAEEASQRAVGRVDFPALREKIGAPVLLVTHGGKGVQVVEP